MKDMIFSVLEFMASILFLAIFVVVVMIFGGEGEIG